jgi:hypothetical protein
MNNNEELAQRPAGLDPVGEALDGLTVTVGDQLWRLAMSGVDRAAGGGVELRFRMEGPYNRVRQGRVTVAAGGTPPDVVADATTTILRAVAEWLPNSDAMDEFHFVMPP